MNDSQLTSKAGPRRQSTSTAKHNWKLALKKAKEHEDPWKDLDFDSVPECRATRQVYDPRSRSWWRDEIVTKIQEKVRTVDGAVDPVGVAPNFDPCTLTSPVFPFTHTALRARSNARVLQNVSKIARKTRSGIGRSCSMFCVANP